MDGWQLLAGTIFTAALALIGQRFVSRDSVRVAKLSVEGEAYVRARGHLMATIDGLSKQVDEFRHDQAEDRRRIISLEQGRERDQERILKLEARVADERRKYNAAIRYAVALRDALRAAIPQISLPPEPPEIHVDLLDPEGRRK